MNTNSNIIATFQDRFGEERKIHSTRHGLKVQRNTPTPCQVISQKACDYIGEKIRHYRTLKGLSGEQLAMRAALSTGSSPKQRMYEIEKNKRGIGLRMGTIYQIAIALDVSISDLLPSNDWVVENCGIIVKPEARVCFKQSNGIRSL